MIVIENNRFWFWSCCLQRHLLKAVSRSDWEHFPQFYICAKVNPADMRLQKMDVASVQTKISTALKQHTKLWGPVAYYKEIWSICPAQLDFLAPITSTEIILTNFLAAIMDRINSNYKNWVFIVEPNFVKRTAAPHGRKSIWSLVDAVSLFNGPYRGLLGN